MQVELAKGGGRRGSRGVGGPGGGYGGSLSRRSEYRVMVTGLPSHCSWQDLKDFMRKVGDVTFANVSPPLPRGPAQNLTVVRAYGGPGGDGFRLQGTAVNAHSSLVHEAQFRSQFEIHRHRLCRLASAIVQGQHGG